MPPGNPTTDPDLVFDEWLDDGDEEVLPDKVYGRRRPDLAYLRGPVPWPWVLRAGALPGQALFVGLMVWKLAGMRRAKTVTFCLSKAARDSVPLRSARRALRALERAGLVKVERRTGRGLLVTLLPTPEKPEGDKEESR
jgi:hypothetical protein